METVQKNKKVLQFQVPYKRGKIGQIFLGLSTICFICIASTSTCFAFGLRNVQQGWWYYEIDFDKDELLNKTLSVDAQIPDEVKILSFELGGRVERKTATNNFPSEPVSVTFTPNRTEGPANGVVWTPSDNKGFLNSSSTESFLFTSFTNNPDLLFNCLVPFIACEARLATWSLNPEVSEVAPAASSATSSGAVPFEFSPSLGLITMTGLFGISRHIKSRVSARKMKL